MQQNTPDFSQDLTPKQLLALPHIASAASASEGARVANIDRSTLRRWMDDPTFRSELESMREEAFNLALSELQGLALKGALVIAESLNDPSPSIRLRAANAALRTSASTTELRRHRKQVRVLENALSNLKQQL